MGIRYFKQVDSGVIYKIEQEKPNVLWANMLEGWNKSNIYSAKDIENLDLFMEIFI